MKTATPDTGYLFKAVILTLLIPLLHTPTLADDIPVRSQPLGELLQQPTFSAPATVESLNAPTVSAQTSGLVTDIPVRVGDHVSKGDLLVQLDCRYQRAQLAAAQAGLKRIEAARRFASTQLKRARNLKNKSSISQELLDQRLSELQGAQADQQHQRQLIKQHSIDVERCSLAAPFDAVVSKRLASVGSLANPGTGLLQLIQLSGNAVSAELRNAEVTSLQQARAITFSYAGQNYPLSLKALIPVINERTRTQQARLSFNTESAPAGAAGRLIWQGPANQLAADYLVRRKQRLGIFIARRNKAHFHVLMDAREGQPVSVDLPANSLIITEGRQRLQHGDTISTAVSGQ